MAMAQEIIEPEIVDNIDKKENNNINKQNNKNKKLLSWFWLIISGIYLMSPFDAIPDIVPVCGWLDDFLIVSAVLVNFVQQNFLQYNQTLNKILDLFKKILILLVILISLVFILIIFLFIKN